MSLFVWFASWLSARRARALRLKFAPRLESLRELLRRQP